MELQKTWDACLIRCWRMDLTLWDVVKMYQSITSKEPADLLRMPADGFPKKIRVRVFMDQHLNKISERLWAQAPEKDIALLRKLQASKYDTSKQGFKTEATNALSRASKSIKNSNGKTMLDLWKHHRRNHKTDWNVHQ